MDFKRTITDSLSAKKAYVDNGQIIVDGEAVSIDTEVAAKFEGKQITISVKAVSEDEE